MNEGIESTARRSVPSGRVGNAKDAIFRSNEHFREAVAEREGLDVQARSLPCLPSPPPHMHAASCAGGHLDPPPSVTHNFCCSIT